jgi:hypothetical protein
MMRSSPIAQNGSPDRGRATRPPALAWGRCPGCAPLPGCGCIVAARNERNDGQASKTGVSDAIRPAALSANDSPSTPVHDIVGIRDEKAAKPRSLLA